MICIVQESGALCTRCAKLGDLTVTLWLILIEKPKNVITLTPQNNYFHYAILKKCFTLLDVAPEDEYDKKIKALNLEFIFVIMLDRIVLFVSDLVQMQFSGKKHVWLLHHQ